MGFRPQCWAPRWGPPGHQGSHGQGWPGGIRRMRKSFEIEETKHGFIQHASINWCNLLYHFIHGEMWRDSVTAQSKLQQRDPGTGVDWLGCWRCTAPATLARCCCAAVLLLYLQTCWPKQQWRVGNLGMVAHLFYILYIILLYYYYIIILYYIIYYIFYIL